MGRAGKRHPQPGGYAAFFPAPLPPNPAVAIDDDLANKLALANRELGRLDGTTEILPNTEMFVYMYVRKEAVLSSQIEGTQASLIDVLQLESETDSELDDRDVQEVVNYIRAMDFGLRWIQEQPISLELLKAMHGILLSDAGPGKMPGEFRNVQNWIGPREGGIRRAIFVPVPEGEPLRQALLDLERFLQDSSPIPTLLASGIAHAQFETIHPFIDGNGRIGRLMLTLNFCQQRILARPVLYLSYFFKLRRVEYFDRLQAVRDHGDWEGWLKFYLTGLSESAQEATSTARQIVNMRETHRRLIAAKLGKQSGKALELLETLYRRPMVTVQGVQQLINANYQYANRLIDNLQQIGILREMTGQRRNRRFGYGEYIDLFKTEDS